MKPTDSHLHKPDVSFDGGDMDCGNGLLLQIRQHLDKLETGQLLEILSVENSVEEDLPAWCRLTSNQLVSWTKQGQQRSYLICRGQLKDARSSDGLSGASAANAAKANNYASTPVRATAPASRIAFRPIPPLSVMGIGSWPRPLWLMPYLHKHLEGKISDDEFDAIADDAVRLCVVSQERAGVDFITDGEQRRDNYASFVGMRLDGCQLIPLTDLLPMVDDPEKFQEELKSLDVPADKVRHPAVTGTLARKPGGIAGRELEFLRSISSLPVKIAWPGPYLLSRLMWMECITDKVYKTREEIAAAAVKVLREEIADLLANGAAIVQLDEPVLSEIVFTGQKNARSFMCGALSERGDQNEELLFATELINSVCEGFPSQRLAMHICRGNWTPDESAALSGGYEPLLPLLNAVNVGMLFLEYCTPRAGELDILKEIRSDLRIGLGSVNQKNPAVETVDSIVQKAKACIDIIGPKRLLLNPDCGFATFADNPVSSAAVAEAKLRALKEASVRLRKEYF